MSMFSQELRKHMDEQGIPPAPVKQTAQIVQPVLTPQPTYQSSGVNELLIKGLIVGVALFLVWALIVGVKAFIRAPSEGAQRLKVVTGVGLAAFVIYGAAATDNLVVLVLTAAIIGAVVWVSKGFAKK